MRKILWPIIFAGLFSVSAHAQQETNRQEEINYLRNVMPTKIIEYAHIEIPDRDYISLNNASDGNFISLRANHGQPKKNNGVRSEISVDFPYAEGEMISYSWQFMIAHNFQSDSPQNRWWIFGQWHEQPNRTRGETWDGFPTNSPPVILGYGQINGQDCLSLGYGAPESKPIALLPFARGTWQDVKATIKWSQKSDGHIELTVNGTTVKVDGANMLNDFQHYLKLGSYRNPDIDGDVWVNIRNINIKRIK